MADSTATPSDAKPKVAAGIVSTMRVNTAKHLKHNRGIFLFVLLAVAVHVEIFYWTGRHLFSRDHYQFFPLVLCAAGILAWIRLGDLEREHEPCLTIRVIIWGMISALLFSGAVLLQISFLGALTIVASLWTLVWFIGGQDVAERLRGPMLLILMVIPPPMNLDLKVVIALQKIASSFASSLLDMEGVRHILSGVAITTSEKIYMVNEACSGVHSLFSSLCIIMFLSVLQRLGLLHLILNMVQTTFWVILANACRVFLIVYSFTRWNIDLDTGWKHDLLGVFTFLLTLAMAASTDKLLQLVVPPMRRKPTPEEDDILSAEAEFMVQPPESVGQRIQAILNKPRLNQGLSVRLATVILLLIFAPLASVSAVRLFRTGQNATSAEAIDSKLTEDVLLPQAVGQWNLLKTERINRQSGDPRGRHSIVFAYERGGLTAKFSLDGYYSTWHNLGDCYTAIGWQVLDQENQRDEATGIHSTYLQLRTEDGRNAAGYFSCFDRLLSPVPPGNVSLEITETFLELSTELLSRMKNGYDSNRAPKKPPLFQLQLLCSSDYELLGAEVDSLNRLFKELTELSLRSLKESTR